ncbi:MAG: Ig-like domain-containing protein, partial [Pseudomonadota bacterium]
PATGETELVSVNTSGEAANGIVTGASISADGRFVVMTSEATNLDDDDINGAVEDVFLRDLETGSTRLLSQFSSADVSASFDAVISADGSTVVFHTANQLDPNDSNGLVDVYALDLTTGVVDLVSRTTGAPMAGDGPSFVGGVQSASVSANGRYVAYSSAASDLIAGVDGNGDIDVFVYDRELGSTELVSRSLTGAQGDAMSFAPRISADGRFVAFDSFATNLDVVFGDTNDARDVFVHDRVTGELVRASAGFGAGGFVEPGGAEATISADGRFVGFVSANAPDGFAGGVGGGDIEQIFVAEISNNGFSITEDDGVVSLDFAKDIFDFEDDELFIDNVSIESDDLDRIVDFTLDDSGPGGRSTPFVEIDADQFDALGVGDFEILTATFDVFDGTNEISAILGIVVEGVNDAPVALDQTFSVGVGETLTTTLFATDVDGDDLTFTLVGQPPVSDFSLDADGALTLVGEVGAPASFDVLVSDGKGGETTFAVNLAVDQPPVFSPVGGALVSLNGQANSIDLSVFFDDPEGGDLSFAAQQVGGADIAFLTLDPATGILSGTHGAAQRLDRIEVTATDDSGLSTTGEFWLAYVDEEVTDGDADAALTGTLARTIFDGGPGDDLIDAGGGFDIFVYDFADGGFDQLVEEVAGSDGIVLIDGAFASDLSFTRAGAGEDLLITLAGEEFDFENGLLLSGGLGANLFEGLAFADGSELSIEEIRADILAGETTAADDLITGFAGADVIAGGLGDDTLRGRDGADVYRVAPGEGFDVIQEDGFFDADVLEIAANVADATFERGPRDVDLTIRFAAGGGVTVLNSLNGDVNDEIASFVFADQTLSVGEVRQRLVDQFIANDVVLIAGFGVDGGEVFDNLLGNETLSGAAGDDVYVYRDGDGDLVIQDRGFGGDDEIRIFDFELRTNSVDGTVAADSQVTFDRALDDPTTLVVNL